MLKFPFFFPGHVSNCLMRTAAIMIFHLNSDVRTGNSKENKKQKKKKKEHGGKGSWLLCPLGLVQSLEYVACE